MTRRLYYSEPSRRTFSARVLECEPRGDGFAVALDATTFYPTSGGQPFDTGTLGGVRVLDVLDREDGAVVHVTSGALRVGDIVTGDVDWPRRFDHMQQHTGQHILSAAFDRLFEARTESFHLGPASATIDLSRAMTMEELRLAEDEANRVVWEERVVSIREASAEEARAMPLRKEPARSGPLRLIDIDDFDLSACGGTHVSRTGAVGVIATLSTERVRRGTRVEFVCGGRVLARVREWRDALHATNRHLSVPPAELPAAVERVQAESRQLQKMVRAQQELLAAHEAAALVARGARHADRLVVVEALDGWDAAGLKALASAASAHAPDALLVLFTAGEPRVCVVAAGAASGADASSVLAALVSRHGGRGGGKRDLAQGGGFTAPLDALLAAARDAARG